jgi:hypothetical protein
MLTRRLAALSAGFALALGALTAVPASAAQTITNGGHTAVGACTVNATVDSTPTTSDCPSASYGLLNVGSSRNVGSVFVGSGWKQRIEYSNGTFGNWSVGPAWWHVQTGAVRVWSERTTDTTPGWLSGASVENDLRGAKFSKWRGSNVEIGETWLNDAAAYTLVGTPSTSCGGCGEWAGFPGAMSVNAVTPNDGTMPGDYPSDAASEAYWAAEASGRHDAYWASLARNVRTARAGLGKTYFGPWYEFNGDWMPYSVKRTAAAQASFRTAYARVTNIIRANYPEAVVGLPPACSRDIPAAMTPVTSSFDIYTCTQYNAWPVQANGADAVASLEQERQRAAAWGKPFGITEWANVSTPGAAGGGGGDHPGYITAMHNWLSANAGTGAGKVEFETYFNVGGYGDRFELTYTNGSGNYVLNPQQPKTATEYARLF